LIHSAKVKTIPLIWWILVIVLPTMIFWTIEM